MSFDGGGIDCSCLFKCKQCGDCCQGYGGTYVTSHDIQKISAYTGIEKKRLISEFCVLSGKKYLLAQKEDGYCIFWDKTCGIHPVKPKMCSDWPFIPALLKHPDNWRIMAGTCPGMAPEATEAAILQCTEQQLHIPKKDIRK
ncbi:MAG: YkgJ family cysteine cluster protein [Deltaproteobacteria bacterium]|nr:YkgJ family cysteine cluster protein [Deltaproteobacteria bacterium]